MFGGTEARWPKRASGAHCGCRFAPGVRCCEKERGGGAGTAAVKRGTKLVTSRPHSGGVDRPSGERESGAREESVCWIQTSQKGENMCRSSERKARRTTAERWSGIATRAKGVLRRGQGEWNGRGTGGGHPACLFPERKSVHTGLSRVRSLGIACVGFLSLGIGRTAAQPCSFVQVAAGHSHVCAIRPDKTLACWGLNWFGQANPPPGAFAQVDGGWDNNCARRVDGRVVCWGHDGMGQSSPPDGTFVQVSTGASSSCGLRSDGALVCWGTPLWDPELSNGPSPGEVFTQLSVGGLHVCALRPTGTVGCWGRNIYGQASPPPGTFTQISAGWGFTCGLRPDGSLVCWGNNAAGQASPPSGSFVQVSAGREHACALRSDGTVVCWGGNGSGEASPPSGTYSQVSAGGYFTCALSVDGSVTCWGDSRSYAGIESASPCDDDRPCTVDACVAGSCVHTPVPNEQCPAGYSMLKVRPATKARAVLGREAQAQGQLCAERVVLGGLSRINAGNVVSGVNLLLRQNATVEGSCVVGSGGRFVQRPGADCNGGVDISGTHPLLGDCEAATDAAGRRLEILAKLPADNSDPGMLWVKSDTTVDVTPHSGPPGSVVVLDFGRVQVDRGRILTIVGNANTEAVVVRISGSLRVESGGRIMTAGITPGPNGSPAERLLFLVGGRVTLRGQAQAQGTIVAEGMVKLGRDAAVRGALLSAGTMRLGWSADLLHAPWVLW